MKTMPIVLRAAGLASLVLLLCLAAADPAAALLDGSKLKKGQPAPDFTLQDLDGKT